jgi:site-specific recombinase XerD
MHNENNANIVIIQKILGHEHLSSTEIYTHVTNKKMRELMDNCTISSILEKMEEKSNGKE